MGVDIDDDAPENKKEVTVHKTLPEVEAAEPILTEEKSRHVYFPVMYKDVHEMYNNAKSSYWVAEEINFEQDLSDLNRLSQNEKHFIKQVLAFFAASDGIVMEKGPAAIKKEAKVVSPVEMPNIVLNNNRHKKDFQKQKSSTAMKTLLYSDAAIIS